MNRSVSTVTVLAGLLLGLTGGWVAQSAVAGSSPVAEPASASPAVPTSVAYRVRGTQVPVNPDKGQYAMRGALVGRWTVVPAKTLHDTPQLYVEAGRERFVGCVDRNRDASCQVREPHGTLLASYIYWASFDGGGKLIRGRCVHPVTGGTLSFGGARGVINMVDTPVGNAVRTTYAGRVVLRTAAQSGAGAGTVRSFGAPPPRAFEPGAAPPSSRRAC